METWQAEAVKSILNEYAENNPEVFPCGCVRLTTRLNDGSLGWGKWLDGRGCDQSCL